MSNASSGRGNAGGLYVLRQTGDGSFPPVVLVHGAMDRSTSFGRVVKHLGDVDVIRYDRRGYGRSSVGESATLATHVEDLLAVIGDDPAVVFGHSLGGVIAVAAAEQRPDLVRAVLAYEPPTPWIPGWPPGRTADPDADPAGEAERFMRRMVGDRIWERLPASTRAARRAEGPALRGDLSSVQLEHPPFDPTGITVPVVVAAGSEADEWHRTGVEVLAEEIPGAVSKIVEGASHGIHLTHPKLTAGLVSQLRDLVR